MASSEALARKTARNSLFSALEFVTTLALTFAVTPIVVHHLGSERYGILALSTTFVGFMALLDVGMGSALGRSLAQHHARGEIRESEAVFGASLTFYAGIGLLGLGLSLLFAGPLLPHLFDLTTSLGQARVAFVVSGIGFALTMLAVPFRTVPLSLQRIDAAVVINVGVAALTATASVALVVSGFGLVAVVAANVLGAAVALGFNYRLAGRLAPSLRMHFAWDMRLLRSIIAFGLLVFVAQISAVVLFQLDRIVLGAIASVSLVTYYVVPALLAQRLQTLATKLTFVVFPAATDLLARGDRGLLLTLYRRANRMLFIGLASVATPLFVAGPPLLRYWLGDDFAGRSGNVLRVLVLTYFVISITTVAYYLALGFGRPGVPAVIYGVCAITNIVLLFALIPSFKLMGAAVAYLLSVLPLLALLWFADRLLSLRSRHWIELIWRALPMIAFEAVLATTAAHFADNLFEIVLSIIGTAVAGLIAYFGLLADEGDLATLHAFMPAPGRRFLKKDRG